MGKKSRDREAGAEQDLHAFGEAALDDAQDGPMPQPALALDDDERLPWLESADDEGEETGAGNSRLRGLGLLGLALLVAVVAVLWFNGQRGQDEAGIADGSVIKAPAPYKEIPRNQSGKTFAGTGDSAFAVSEGKTTGVRLDQGGAPSPSIAVDGAAAPADPGVVGVQIGAYSSAATAEAGWIRLSGGQEALKGVKHRVVEGTADIGTVYRLQALAPNAEAANALCSTLKAAGVACQVKR